MNDPLREDLLPELDTGAELGTSPQVRAARRRANGDTVPIYVCGVHRCRSLVDPATV